MAAIFEHKTKNRVPEELAGTQAGRLLAAILADPSRAPPAARPVPARGARAVNVIPAIARRHAGAAGERPAASLIVVSEVQIEAAKAAVGRRDRRVGIELVAAAAAIVALAIALVLVFSRGPGVPAPAAEDASLVIEEPLRVIDDGEEVTTLAPMVIDHRLAGD